MGVTDDKKADSIPQRKTEFGPDQIIDDQPKPHKTCKVGNYGQRDEHQTNNGLAPLTVLRQSVKPIAPINNTGNCRPCARKLQAHLAIPATGNLALDFMRFCQRNPKPCTAGRCLLKPAIQCCKHIGNGRLIVRTDVSGLQ